MTYGYVQNAINQEALPKFASIYQKEIMTGRGKGKYCYKDALRREGEDFLRKELVEKLNGIPILYIV